MYTEYDQEYFENARKTCRSCNLSTNMHLYIQNSDVKCNSHSFSTYHSSIGKYFTYKAISNNNLVKGLQKWSYLHKIDGIFLSESKKKTISKFSFNTVTQKLLYH